MPIRWKNSNVRNFKHNAPPTNVTRSFSYKNNIINGKNMRGNAPVLENNNIRRQNLYNPYLNPQKAHENIAKGINVPRNYSRKLTPENAFKHAEKTHANWLRNHKPEATRNENMWTNNNLSNVSRNENMWTDNNLANVYRNINMRNNAALPLVSLPKTNIKRVNWNQRSRKVRNRNMRDNLKVVRNPFYTIKSRSL